MPASGSARRRDEAAASRKRQLWLARVPLAVAVFIAGYLANASLSGAALPGCRLEDGCSDALSSSWASWLGMPVSLPAIALYLMLLFATFAVERKLPQVARRRLWIASLTLGSIILVAAIWFVALQTFALERWCSWCATAQLLSSVGAGIMIHRAWVVSRSPEPVLTTKEFGGFGAGAAALGWVVLAAGQLTSATPAAATTAGMAPSSSAQLKLKGTIVLHDGRFELNPTELPLIGSADAKAILVGLFDYTCAHCRETRRVVKKAIERASGRLAIISLPMPLDRECNHLVTRTTKEHAHACEYGALALGVFRAKSAAFPEFEHWLFEPVEPPTIEQARSKAMELVGVQPLSRAMRDPWIGERLVNNIALYEANARASGGDTRLPQIVMGDALIQGTIGTADELFQLLARHAPSRSR